MDDGGFQRGVKHELKGRPHSFKGVIRGHYYDFSTLIRFVDAVVVGGLLWLLVWMYGYTWNIRYASAAVASTGLFFVITQFLDIYHSRRGSSLAHDLLQLCTAWIVVVMILQLIGYAMQISEQYSRLVILTWIVATPAFLGLWHGFINHSLGVLRKNGVNTQRVAIVGARKLGAEFARTLLESRWMGLQPIGFYDDRKPAGNRPLATEPIRVIGDLDLLVRHAKERKIDTIYITLPLRAEDRIRKLLDQLSDTTVSVCLVPDFFVYNLMNAGMSNLGEYPVVSIYETPFNGVDGWIKRWEDIVLSSLILMVIAMPMLLIVIGIKLSSPGPVFFKQIRYGLNGQKIYVWKFRTMSVCEDGPVVTQAVPNDPRITRFGSFLRRYSLDELPQFINVLQGRMSIVGPRPYAVAHNEQYRSMVKRFMLRHKVKPGITGLAQIYGWRGAIDSVDQMEEKVNYDFAYIHNWSLWLDLKIILRTAFGAFFSRAAS